MGPLHGPKHGTIAWPQAWDHCMAPNMGPLHGPKHGTIAWPQTWDLTNPPPWEGVIACFPKNFRFDLYVNLGSTFSWSWWINQIWSIDTYVFLNILHQRKVGKRHFQMPAFGRGQLMTWPICSGVLSKILELFNEIQGFEMSRVNVFDHILVRLSL